MISTENIILGLGMEPRNWELNACRSWSKQKNIWLVIAKQSFSVWNYLTDPLATIGERYITPLSIHRPWSGVDDRCRLSHSGVWEWNMGSCYDAWPTTNTCSDRIAYSSYCPCETLCGYPRVGSGMDEPWREAWEHTRVEYLSLSAWLR